MPDSLGGAAPGCRSLEREAREEFLLLDETLCTPVAGVEIEGCDDKDAATLRGVAEGCVGGGVEHGTAVGVERKERRAGGQESGVAIIL